MKLRKRFLPLLLILSLISGCGNTKSNTVNPTAVPELSKAAAVTVTKSTVKPPASSPTLTPALSKTATPTPAPTANAVNAVVAGSAASKNAKKALTLLKNMTLEEKIGQMFFVRCNKNTAVTDIKKYHFGGYILFSEDFEGQTKTGIRKKLAGYQSASAIPLLIGVDEEGGTVNRISKYPAFRSVPFQSPQELYRLGGFTQIVSDTVEKARLLKSLGINVNLAPVCDVSTNSKDFIYKRSFGQNAKKTSEYVKTVVTTMKQQGIGSTLKHFPGYGNNVDTHTGIAIDNRSSKQFYQIDFLPFTAGIRAEAGSILVSHNIVKAFDKAYPASLSAKVHTLLRTQLKFSGVILSDDLSMDAIKEYTNNKAAAVMAVQAGNDLLIATDYDVQLPAVITAVKSHKISEKRINESVQRILEWKLSLGIIK